MEKRKKDLSTIRNNTLFLTEEITAVLRDLLSDLESRELITSQDRQAILALQHDSERGAELLKRLRIEGDDDYAGFINCLKVLRLNNAVKLLTKGGVVVRVKVFYKPTADSEPRVKKLLDELNSLDSVDVHDDKNKVAKQLRILKEHEIKMLKAVSIDGSAFGLWLWCRSSWGLRQLETMTKSNDIVRLVSKLIRAMPLTKPITPTVIDVDRHQFERTLDDPLSNLEQDEVTDLINCRICLEEFKDPRALPCLHTFCLSCLEEQGKCCEPDEKICCPICRREVQLSPRNFKKLPVNFYATNICGKVKKESSTDTASNSGSDARGHNSSKSTSSGSTSSGPGSSQFSSTPSVSVQSIPLSIISTDSSFQCTGHSYDIPSWQASLGENSCAPGKFSSAKVKPAPPFHQFNLETVTETFHPAESYPNKNVNAVQTIERGKSTIHPDHSGVSRRERSIEVCSDTSKETELKIASDADEDRQRQDPQIYHPTCPAIVQRLHMKEYYQRKLLFQDVVTVTDEVDSQHICLQIIREIMKLDCRSPFNSTSPTVQEKHKSIPDTALNQFDQFLNSSFYAEDEDPASVHPMDVMNVIYNCCDDLLLQILMEKMFMCQLAIPLVFPQVGDDMSTVSLWSLRSISPDTVTDDTSFSGISLVDIPLPFVSFMRIGELKHSKSKLLNDLLRTTPYDTFFHRDCRNGMLERKHSNGTIEAFWFQPSGNKSSEFRSMFCILNLRGDLTQHLNEATSMSKIASLNFVMIDTNTLESKNYERYAEVCEGASVCLCFLTESVGGVNLELFKECLEYFKNTQLTIKNMTANWRGRRMLNADEWKNEIKTILVNHLYESDSKCKVKDFVQIAKTFSQCSIDEESMLCSRAYNRLEDYREFLSTIDPCQNELELFPLQGELWKSWGMLERQLQSSRSCGDMVEDVISQEDTKKKDLRRQQLELVRSDSTKLVKLILDQLKNCENDTEFRLVATWVRILFEEWNGKCSHGSQHGDNQMLHFSKFLNDHIFREFGQLCEAIECGIMDDSGKVSEDFKMYHDLPEIVAHLFLTGLPLELYDGNTSFVPLTWLQSVFNEIQKLLGNEKKIFVVSVLGTQSSGKSTLLNIMFGLQFAVSAGRCTRGVFCQLIPADKRFVNEKYDYIMVVDTEGLCAPGSGPLTRAHDNELATFVVGLANVTIVNIKGENSVETQHLLENVVIALIRMENVLKDIIKPTCLFVHQNVNYRNAKEALRLGKANMVMMLDRVTKTFADQQNLHDINHFRDIIDYDESEHSVYLPDLWQGDPPMAPINCGYTEQVGYVKELLIRRISVNSKVATFEQFGRKLKNLWNAVLRQEYVFHYRNSEEEKACSKLDRVYLELLWKLKSKGTELTSNIAIRIQACEGEVLLLSKTLQAENKELLRVTYTVLQKELDDYFGSICSNETMLGQWRDRYQTNLEMAYESERSNVSIDIERHSEFKTKQLKLVEKSILFQTELLTNAAQESADMKLSNTKIKTEELTRSFEEKWSAFESEMKTKFTQSADSIETIKTSLIKTIESELNSFLHLQYLSNKVWNISGDRSHCSFDDFPDMLKRDETKTNLVANPIEFSSGVAEDSNFRQRCLISAQRHCSIMLARVEKYVNSHQGMNFSPHHINETFNIAKQYFSNTKFIGFVFHTQFQIDFIVFVAKCAAQAFVKNESEVRQNIHILDQIQGQKPVLQSCFTHLYCSVSNSKKNDENKTAAHVVARILSNWVKRSVENNFGRNFSAEIGKIKDINSKKTFVKHVLTELAENKKFDDYTSFLKNSDAFFRMKLKGYLTSLVKSKKRSWTKSNLESVVERSIKTFKNKVVTQLDKMEEYSPTVLSNYFALLQSDLQQAELYTTNVNTIVVSLRVTDLKKFARKLKKVVAKINDEPLFTPAEMNHLMDSVNVTDVLGDTLLGCTEKCPFCSSMCSRSPANHTGCHVALQHLPIGVRGFHGAGNKLHTYTCEAAVSGDVKYCFDLDSSSKTESYNDYKRYHSDWDIPPEKSVETSAYWKWFMTTFNAELAKYYNLEPAYIPQQWKSISWEKAKKHLERC